MILKIWFSFNKLTEIKMVFDDEKKEFAGWWFFGLLLIVVASVVLSVLGYMGKLTDTVVEREVFKSSYQYQAGKTEANAIFQAQLAEINMQLASRSLTDSQRTELEAQAAALRVQIAANRSK